MIVRPMERDDVAQVVERVAQGLASDARREPLVCSQFSRSTLRDALRGACESTWVAQGPSEIAGHLFAAVLDDASGHRRAWVGPDGVSFNRPETLESLYQVAESRWSQLGANEHLAWVFRDDLAPWHSLGFTNLHVRGSRSLDGISARAWPRHYLLRCATSDDLELARSLDVLVDEDVSTESPGERALDEGRRRDEWRELLADPEVRHLVVEHRGSGVAQIVCYALGRLRGSFDRTVHLSALAVHPDHRRRGVGGALVSEAISLARREGFRYADVQWRSGNDPARAFWIAQGFTPTYVRVGRRGGSL